MISSYICFVKDRRQLDVPYALAFLPCGVTGLLDSQQSNLEAKTKEYTGLKDTNHFGLSFRSPMSWGWWNTFQSVLICLKSPIFLIREPVDIQKLDSNQRTFCEDNGKYREKYPEIFLGKVSKTMTHLNRQQN